MHIRIIKNEKIDPFPRPWKACRCFVRLDSWLESRTVSWSKCPLWRDRNFNRFPKRADLGSLPARQDGEVKSLVCPWHYRGETIQRPQPHPLLLESYQSMGAPDLSWFGEKKKRKA
jgi:hypothetical protein